MAGKNRFSWGTPVRKTRKAKKTTSTGSRKTEYVVTARFPNGQVIPIRASGVAGRDKAIAAIKKNAPSAKYTVKKA